MAPTDAQGLRRILAVVDLLLDATAESTLLPALLPALLSVVPADTVICRVQKPAGPVGYSHPADLLDPAMMVEFERHAADDPLVVHTRTGPGRPVRRSDLQTASQYRALGTYAAVYRPLRADHQLALSFQAGAGRCACIAFSRSRTDFSDADLATADILRPRLARTMTRFDPRPRHAPLTAREAEVIELLSHGRSNRQIAHQLDISPRTVDKHLEHAYAKLHSQGAGRVAVAARWRADVGERG